MHVRNLTARAEADQIAADVDSGPAAAILRIYDATGGIPADADVAITTQVLLAEITMNDPAFAAAVDANPGGRIDADVIPIPEDSSANATGTAAFGRLDESTGTTIVQFDTVTVTSGGGEIEINSINIQAGAAVQLTGGSITVPES
jgi:hypothetical protein